MGGCLLYDGRSLLYGGRSLFDDERSLLYDGRSLSGSDEEGEFERGRQVDTLQTDRRWTERECDWEYVLRIDEKSLRVTVRLPSLLQQTITV